MGLPRDYLFAGILVALAIGMSVAMVFVPQIISRLLRLNRPNPVKLQSYECGITPTGSARRRYPIKFYQIAMLFILFDIEAIFFYPWAAVHRWLGWYGLIEMGVFVFVLLVGFVYIWRRGALQWE